MNKNFIVLNGKRYDATTGELLGSAEDTARPAQTQHVEQKAEVVQPSVATNEHAEHHAVPKVHKTDRTRHVAHVPSGLHKKPEPSKTLMRRAVQKPAKRHRTSIKRNYPVVKKTRGIGISPKLSVNTVDHGRLRRSKSVAKSEQVERFRKPPVIVAAQPAQPEIKEHASVVSIQQHAPAYQPQPEPIAIVHAPIEVREPIHTPSHVVQPHHNTQTHHKPAHAEVRHTSHEPAVTHHEEAPRKIKIFEEALASATSHQQQEHKLPKKLNIKKLKLGKNRRLLSSAAGMCAVLVIGGFVMYANKSSVELQMASVRAGFHASMPSYEPEGYNKQPATTKDGKVAINFLSPKDYTGFTLTQEPSDWDSQTLFDTVVSASDSAFQTVQSNGRTIYVYGNNHAAWVDGGVLYKITGNAKLKSDQIIKLAASM